MTMQFWGKKPHVKYVRPLLNTRRHHKLPSDVLEAANQTEATAETVTETVNNNEVKEEKAMNDEKLAAVEQMLGTKATKKRIKVEKKDKGLIEHDAKDTILITEDNKLILND